MLAPASPSSVNSNNNDPILLNNNEGENSPNKSSSCFKTRSFKIYVCHSFSSWGDQMWSWAVGMYMAILFPDSLLLTAIYGFSNCLSGIILGPCIGRWIDQSERFQAAKTSVLVQNGAVVIGGIILTATLYYHGDLLATSDQVHFEYFVYALIILVAIVAELASVACRIFLERDWIVVLAAGDTKKLAKLNSNMRTINLATIILAPFVVSQIMHYLNPEAGAVFIAVWNLISGVIEYTLLLDIYNSVPELRHKATKENLIPFVKIIHNSNSSQSSFSTSTPTPPISLNNNNNKLMKIHPDQPDNNLHLHPSTTPPKFLSSPGPDFEHISLMTPTSSYQVISPVIKNKGPAEENVCRMACNAWKLYFSHHVLFAGGGLSLLYLTVLDGHAITMAFIYNQGVRESFIGIVTGIGAIFGIMGSLLFPILRRKLGKNNTGILGFTLETLALLLCVGSIFMEGSPFQWGAIRDRFDHFSGTNSSSYDVKQTYNLPDLFEKETHVVMLMMGITLARFGLWIADLTVTQTFQEEIEEYQRGVLNGVQDSLNKFMDLCKFALVILLPAPETFGYLIFVSWITVFLGTLCFIIFARKDERKKKIENEEGNRPIYNMNAESI